MTILESPMPDYRQYVADIQFSGLGPMDEGIVLLTGHNPPRISVADLTLTRLPFHDREMKARLGDVCRIPRMSTFAIGALINVIVSRMPEGQAYVNVGVWNGFTLLAGMAGNLEKTCVGIDNFSEFGGPREAFRQRFESQKGPGHAFFDMDYRDYFKGPNVPAIGFYIYDGDHSREHQHEGLRAAEPFLADGGLILVDDFNVDAAIDGTRDFIEQSPFAYEILLEQHTCHDWHPTFWNGIVLLRKSGKKKP